MCTTRFGLDGFLGVADRCPLGARHPHRGGELRLAAGSAQVHHHVPGDRLCGVCAVVVLDQRQRQIDPCRDAGRRPDLLGTADEDRVGVDRDRRKLTGHLTGECPVGGGHAAVDQPGLCRQICPGADADDAAGALGCDLDPADGVRVAPHGVHAVAAGQDKGVDRLSGIRQRRGNQREARARRHGLAVAGDHLDRITLVGTPVASEVRRRTGEHVGRANQVKRLDARKAENHHRSHLPSVGDGPRGV
jgi:hypothetical protein